MPFIKKIEKEMASNPNLNHEYLWFLGMDKFNEVAPRLILGEKSPALLEGRVSGYENCLLMCQAK
jgi:aspartate/tyrosine/aromatic aminotransferase